MGNKKGTPKTLNEAIRNGLDGKIQNQYPEHVVKLIELHVRDFLAQKFDPVLMNDPKVVHLWQKIRGAA